MKTIISVFFLVLSANLGCAEPLVLNSRSDIVENYYEEAQRSEQYYFYPFGRETIETQVRDMNGDHRADILVTERNHCDRETGCYWRIYLNLGKETDGPYCLSSETDETYDVGTLVCLADGWQTRLN